MQRRRDDGTSGTLRSARNMAGTSGATLAFVSLNPASIAHGSESPATTKAVPRHKTGVIRLLKPYECENPTSPKFTSSELIPMLSET